MIGIINYGSGNIQAVANIYKRVGITHKIVNTKNDLDEVEKLILPGVGAFDATMKVLNISGLRDALDYQVLEKQKPVLGICVGMQMMGNRSDEGKLEGLKWIDSEILKFDENLIQQRTKLPHMGWNDVKPVVDGGLFKDYDFNEEQLNSSMTFQFYEENESFYTRVIFVGDCPIILRIPRGLSSVPNINGNYLTVQGVVIGRNKIKVSSLSR